MEDILEKNRMFPNVFYETINFVDRVISVFEKVFLILSGIILFIMVFFISYGVLARYFFGLPTSWLVEISEYAMVYLAFLAAPWILKQDGHVRVDILLNSVTEHTKQILIKIGYALASLGCIIYFWYSFQAVIDYYQKDTIIYNILQVPQYLVLLPLPIGSLFLALRFIRMILPEKATNS